MSGLALNGEELSPEVRAIQFEWKPEFDIILQRGYDIHPDIPTIHMGGDGPTVYDTSMPLPDPADDRAALRFCGLNDAKVDEIFEEYKIKFGHDPEPSLAYVEEKLPNNSQRLNFTNLWRFFDIYSKRDEGGVCDYEDTYEGKIKKGIQHGLRPEFAVFCSLYENDPRENVGNRWPYPEPPQYYATESVHTWAIVLENLWAEKLQHEGKVKSDQQGLYIVRDNNAIAE